MNPHAPVHRSALELRYRVYCEQCGFLRPEDYPDRIEVDEHDATAAHFYEYQGEMLVGYARLVRADELGRFPFQAHCVTTVPLPPAAECREVSRLLVRDEPGESVIRGVPLRLYKQMYEYSAPQDIRYWYAAMESSLKRLIGRMRVKVTPIGPKTDYWGPVSPYVVELLSGEVKTLASRLASSKSQR